MPKVTLPDGKILEVPAGATAADAIGKILHSQVLKL